MDDRDIGQEVLEAIREIKAYKAGQIDLRVRKLRQPSAPLDIRKKLQRSQTAFAGMMGVSLRTAEQHPHVFMHLT